MKTNHVLRACFIILFLVSISCSDDDQPAKPKPDGAKLQSLFIENRDQMKQQFTVDAEAGGSVTSEMGVIIDFPAGCFLSLDDDIVTGAVTIEFVEIFDRSTMLLSNMPTLGKTGDDKMAMLISGGEFFMNARQGETPLKPVKGFKIIAPVDNTGEADFDMGVFTGEEECEDDDCDVILSLIHI